MPLGDNKRARGPSEYVPDVNHLGCDDSAIDARNCKKRNRTNRANVNSKCSKWVVESFVSKRPFTNDV